MIPPHLRLSVALAHAVPGAVLRLRGRDGGALIASQHPAADVRLDELRATLLANGQSGHEVDRPVVELEAGGSLLPVGAGVYLSEERGLPCLWFAVPFSPDELVGLDAVSSPSADGAVEVVCRPDHELGVTSIRVAPMFEVDEDALVDVSLRILGVCLVAEIERAMSPRPRH